jgi:hypothetical protein
MAAVKDEVGLWARKKGEAAVSRKSRRQRLSDFGGKALLAVVAADLIIWGIVGLLKLMGGTK